MASNREAGALRLRPYRASDAPIILSWCGDEIGFYQWTAGVLGDYPLNERAFSAVERLMPFTAFDHSGPVGFFTLREPGGSGEELRFGFVIVDPARRGQGCGRAMLRLGLNFAFHVYGARRASLGVFENNPAALRCYLAAGFSIVPTESPETYRALGEAWPCLELRKENAADP
ncbi:MAG: GNAT family N-acetyltransferase [Clostridia bacterium]|nr:GNAT family N-acetyltransferase [Clostridia bacterium]